MKIIAQTSENFLVEATKEELQNILNSVNGENKVAPNIGVKIPAIDYAASISKVKSLAASYDFKQILSKAEDFMETLATLKETVDTASKLEL